MQKPSIPKGTRDFGPQKMNGRNYIFDILKKTFKKYGFMPLETPAMENLSVLTGKYGLEGDQLIFKIINSGNYKEGISASDWETNEAKTLLPRLSEKALRYDLTVPFSRFVVQNRNEIVFPFKRFQIQPVWRADRPQKNRYREFYQADADVVGTTSLLCEAELFTLADEVLTQLGLKDFELKLNNRKILSGIAEFVGSKGRESEICNAIDKLDKIGKEGVIKELKEENFSDTAIENLLNLIQIQGSNQEKLAQLSISLAQTAEGLLGINEIKEVLKMTAQLGIQVMKIDFDPSLARGLSYYTGCIFEIKSNEVQMGSISGGGRYDNLTGLFGLPDVSGVGISFGIDRIYDLMEELNLLPPPSSMSSKVLIATFDKESYEYAFSLLTKLRKSEISAELYPEPTKIKKQMEYADKKQIPFVILIGEDEIKTQKVTLKDMVSGIQQNVDIEQVVSILK